MPDKIPYDPVQRRMIAIAKRLQRNCRQAIVDGEWYNAHRLLPCEAPLDLEHFRVAVHLAGRVLELARRREFIPEELFARMAATLQGESDG